jgi:hypothetical protein
MTVVFVYKRDPVDQFQCTMTYARIQSLSQDQDDPCIAMRCCRQRLGAGLSVHLNEDCYRTARIPCGTSGAQYMIR